MCCTRPTPAASLPASKVRAGHATQSNPSKTKPSRVPHTTQPKPICGARQHLDWRHLHEGRDPVRKLSICQLQKRNAVPWKADNVPADSEMRSLRIKPPAARSTTATQLLSSKVFKRTTA